MHTGRATAAMAALAAVGLGACSSSSSSPATTAGSVPATSSPASSTTAAGSGSTTSVLCREFPALSQEEHGIVTAGQGTPGGVSDLQHYAQQAKAALDQTGTGITAELASAPPIVQSAWSALRPQVDHLFATASTATSTESFATAAAAIESANSFTSTNQTLSAYVQATCPGGSAG